MGRVGVNKSCRGLFVCLLLEVGAGARPRVGGLCVYVGVVVVGKVCGLGEGLMRVVLSCLLFAEPLQTFLKLLK